MAWGKLELRHLVDRVLHLKYREDRLKENVREVYADAKSAGFDKQALGQLVVYLRKRGKDASRFEIQCALFEKYRAAYEQVAHAHAREEADAAKLASAYGHQAPTEGLGSLMLASPTDRPRHESNSTAEAPASKEYKLKPYDLRPHCLRRELCGGSGPDHCKSCLKAHRESLTKPADRAEGPHEAEGYQ